MWKLILILFVPMVLSAAPAGGDEIVSVVPRHLFVPVGFDDNDEVIAVLEGDLPDTCFKLREPSVRVDRIANRIDIDAQSYLGQGICHPLRIPYVITAKIGTLPAGTYEVRTTGISNPETLVVKRAPREMTDDYLYAPVDRVEVRTGSAGELTAHLFGQLSNTCLSVKSVTAEQTGKTFQVLPIAVLADRDPLGLPCRETTRAYEERVKISSSLPHGWYLVHVRTMNGQSRNEVFTNEWEDHGALRLVPRR